MTDIFFGCVFYSEEMTTLLTRIPRRKRRGTGTHRRQEYRLNLKAMDAFFERRERVLSAKRVSDMSMRDGIIEDDTKAPTGCFLHTYVMGRRGGTF